MDSSPSHKSMLNNLLVLLSDLLCNFSTRWINWVVQTGTGLTSLRFCQAPGMCTEHCTAMLVILSIAGSNHVTTAGFDT
jgi:hypothetical protein